MRLFPKKSRTSRHLTVQSRSENALGQGIDGQSAGLGVASTANSAWRLEPDRTLANPFGIRSADSKQGTEGDYGRSMSIFQLSGVAALVQ
jgi:hypothetical protein